MFIFSGAAAAVLRQRYRLLTAVATSGLLALLVFAIEIEQIGTSSIMPSIIPALYGYNAFVFYLLIVFILFRIHLQSIGNV